MTRMAHTTHPLHRARKVNNAGVSALCFKTDQAINLRVASWTLRDEAVTCNRCLAIMRAAATEATK